MAAKVYWIAGPWQGRLGIVPRPRGGDWLEHLVAALHTGRSVALHCRQGIGRSALIAAAVLLSGGQTAETAIEGIRRARGVDLPETDGQRDWIAHFSSWFADERMAERGAAGGTPRPR